MERNELKEIGRNAMGRVLEAGIAAAMTRHIGRGLIADRQRGRAPKVAGGVIAQVKGFTRTIRDGVVGPGRKLVLAAVDRPSGAAAFGRNVKPEAGLATTLIQGAGVHW